MAMSVDQCRRMQSALAYLKLSLSSRYQALKDSGLNDEQLTEVRYLIGLAKCAYDGSYDSKYADALGS